jgi:hypothetical protein
MSVCPYCGFCPCCGRNHNYPFYQPQYQYQYPYYNVCGVGTITGTSGTYNLGGLQGANADLQMQCDNVPASQ